MSLLKDVMRLPVKGIQREVEDVVNVPDKSDLGLLAVRLIAGGMMAGHGAQKLFGWFGGHGLEGTCGFMETLGLQPGQRWAGMAGVGEFGAGILTALGLFHPIGEVLMLGPMAVATGKVHWGKEVWTSQGGAEVPPERRTEVQSLLKDIGPRIGHIMVKSNVAGAVVSVDDVQIGTTPLAQPVDVNPGMRKVSVSKPGYIPATQAITVAGSETDNVDLAMQPTVTIKKGVSPWPFVLWGTTAALAVGAGITGFLAIKNSDDLNTLDGQTPPAGTDAATYAKELESKRNDMRTFSIAADALTIGAVVVGATALVVTIVTFSKHNKEAGPESLSLVVRPGGLGLAGTF